MTPTDHILALVYRFAEARTARRYSDEHLALALLYEAALAEWSSQEGDGNG